LQKGCYGFKAALQTQAQADGKQTRNEKFPFLVPVFVLGSHECTGKKPSFMHNSVAKSGTCFSVVQSLLQLKSAVVHVNPLSPDIKMHILNTDLHTFLMELVRRICPNIKTSYPQ